MATGRVPTTANSPLTTKGDLFGYSTAPARLAVGSDGDTLVADSSTATGLRYQEPLNLNPILNSGFDIWQRGTSIAQTAAIMYSADRWCSSRAGFDVGTTISRQATGDTTNLPNIQYCARIQRNSGTSAVTDIYFSQTIESVNSIPYAGKTITFSFYARKGANFSPAGVGLVVASGTGTDQNILSTYTGASSAIGGTQSFTPTTTWTRYSYTGTVSSSATELGFYFFMTPSGTAGAADYLEITGVMINIGSVAYPYRRTTGTIQGELAACQRYYERRTYNQVCYPYVGQAYASTAVLIPITYSEKRGTPTLTLSGTWKQLNASGTGQAATYGFSHQQVTESDLTATTSGMTAGNASLVETTAGTTYIEISAEL